MHILKEVQENEKCYLMMINVEYLESLIDAVVDADNAN